MTNGRGAETVPNPLDDLKRSCLRLINAPKAYDWALGIWGSHQAILESGETVAPECYDPQAFEARQQGLATQALDLGVDFPALWEEAKAEYRQMELAANES